jgi:hypothetical protein
MARCDLFAPDPHGSGGCLCPHRHVDGGPVRWAPSKPSSESHAPAYLERFGEAVCAEHRKVIETLCPCRTETLGSVCYQCEDGGHPHVVPAACGNRHCPQCQHRKSRLWLERPLERQLPGPHFMLTCTVPEALRAFLYRHPRWGYGALFEASSQAIKARVRDPRFAGGDEAGFCGVLHTGGTSGSTTLTFITSCREGRCRPRMAPGTPPVPGSLPRRCRRSSCRLGRNPPAQSAGGDCASTNRCTPIRHHSA